MAGQNQVAMFGNRGDRRAGPRGAGPAAIAAGRQDGVMAGEDAEIGIPLCQQVERPSQAGLPDAAQRPVRLPLRPPGRAQALDMQWPVFQAGCHVPAHRAFIAPPGRRETPVQGARGHIVIAGNADNRRVETAKEAGGSVELALAAALGEVPGRDNGIGPGCIAQVDEGVDQISVLGTEMKVGDLEKLGHSVQFRKRIGVSEREIVRLRGMKTGSPSSIRASGLRDRASMHPVRPATPGRSPS